jgi:hypothetical protein
MIVNKKALKIILTGTTAAAVIIGTGIALARKKNPAHLSSSASQVQGGRDSFGKVNKVVGGKANKGGKGQGEGGQTKAGKKQPSECSYNTKLIK